VAPDRRLETTDLLAAMPPEVREHLLAHATRRTLQRNELVFDQGDPSYALYVVEDGRVAIVARTTTAKESMLAVLEVGGLFGELALFDGALRSAAVRALVDTTVLELDYGSIRDLFDERPELLWVVTRLLARRLRSTDEALADSVSLDVPARTAKRLLDLAGADEVFTLPVTQEELGTMVGASRERVNKAISSFTNEGWLKVEGRNRYRIVDRPALERRAEN
jgi:CRP-like cAMP-binding protein